MTRDEIFAAGLRLVDFAALCMGAVRTECPPAVFVPVCFNEF